MDTVGALYWLFLGPHILAYLIHQFASFIEPSIAPSDIRCVPKASLTALSLLGS